MPAQECKDEVQKTANRIRFLDHKVVELGKSPKVRRHQSGKYTHHAHQVAELRQLQAVGRVVFYSVLLKEWMQVLARHYHMLGAAFQDLTKRLFEVQSQIPKNVTHPKPAEAVYHFPFGAHRHPIQTDDGASEETGPVAAKNYNNLMTASEKQWLISIQLKQMYSDNPYVDDYYCQARACPSSALLLVDYVEACYTAVDEVHAGVSGQDNAPEPAAACGPEHCKLVLGRRARRPRQHERYIVVPGVDAHRPQ